MLDTLGKLYTRRQPPLRSVSRILAPRLVALAGALALAWFAGRPWHQTPLPAAIPAAAPPTAAVPAAAPPPAANPAAASAAAPAIVAPVAAVAPAPGSERPGPTPAAAPSEPATPPLALELAPPPAVPASAVPPEELEQMSDAQLLNRLELRRLERMPRRER